MSTELVSTFSVIFFFQAEDGIRDKLVTGVQTCALPISGSFRTAGMVIAPCSIKTAGAIASCHTDSLIARAADVTLKEGRPLILLVRETPLHIGHLKCMLALAEMGAVLLPPMPAFYNRPKDLDDIVNHTVARVLDRLNLPQTLVAEWQGTVRRVSTGGPGDWPLGRHPGLQRGRKPPTALGGAVQE